MSDLGRAATARRLYLHVLSGGSLTPDDVSRMVQAIEELEAKLATAMDALEPFAKAGELFDGTPDDVAKSFGVYVPAGGPGYHISGAHVKRARSVIRALKSTTQT